MFDDPSLIVQSAVSSFNNAAITFPSFLVYALLMLPVFALVYFFGNNVINQMKWSEFNSPRGRTLNFAFCIQLVIFLWMILMPGNYMVLRDSETILPVVLSAVLFVTTASIVQKLKVINPPMPGFMQKIKHKKLVIRLFLLLIILLAGFAGAENIWGFALTAAAVFSGMVVGRYRYRGVEPMFMTSVIIFAVTTLVLMQPEFFRFGQMGHLTIIHKFFLLLIITVAIAVITVRNVNARGKIKEKSFKRLKLLMRLISAIGLILFFLTESVPVFLGLAFAILISFAMSVWHAQSVPEKLSKKLWAALLCLFGVTLNLPLITILGILYWVNVPGFNLPKQSEFLL